MKRSLFAVVVFVSLGLVFPTSLATASELTNSTATRADHVSIQLNERITLERWSFEDGSFHLTIDVEVPERLVVSDSMKVVRSLEQSDGGSVRIPRRSFFLDAGTRTIVFPATEFRGESAIMVSVHGGSYLLATGSTTGAWSGPWTTRHLQIAALSAAVSVALVVLYKTLRYFTGASHDPERIV